MSIKYTYAEMDNDKVVPTIRIFKKQSVLVNGKKLSDKICVGRIDFARDAKRLCAAANAHEELLAALHTLVNLQDGKEDGGTGITDSDWGNVRNLLSKI